MDLNADLWRTQRPTSVSQYLAWEACKPPPIPEPAPQPQATRNNIGKASVAGRARPAAVEKNALLARCRLKEAKTIVANRGWEQLPQGKRGQSILRWGADHARLASPANPKRSVRRWCRCWAPWLSDAELSEIVTATETSNKRWSADQCAVVLEISVTDRTRLRLRHIGADNDPFYVARHDIKRTKAAARSRRYRAKHRTGGKTGRPTLELSADERLARCRAHRAKSERRRRANSSTKTTLV